MFFDVLPMCPCPSFFTFNEMKCPCRVYIPCPCPCFLGGGHKKVDNPQIAWPHSFLRPWRLLFSYLGSIFWMNSAMVVKITYRKHCKSAPCPSFSKSFFPIFFSFLKYYGKLVLERRASKLNVTPLELPFIVITCAPVSELPALLFVLGPHCWKPGNILYRMVLY